MAGRGRGRGRGRGKGFPEHWGVGKGDESTSQQPTAFLPPVDFPPLQYKPLPLSAGSEEQFLLIIKRDLQSTISKSPFYVKPVSMKKDIERYSDCYHVDSSTIESQMKIMDESRFPKETRGKKRKATKKIVSSKSKRRTDNVDVEKTLKELESREINENDDEEEDEDAREEGDDDEQIADEDEFEAEIDEGTDYNANYFDNGEDYLDDEDDKLDEGPTF